MRVLQIEAVGAALAYLALSFSQSTNGFPQASLFLLAILTATLTVGIGAAVGLNAWPDDVGVSHVRRRTEHDCHGCGRPMVEVRSVWVCGLCDRASASQPG